jgi:SAM-dependent methyltransferase
MVQLGNRRDAGGAELDGAAGDSVQRKKQRSAEIMIVTLQDHKYMGGGASFSPFIESLIIAHSLKRICEIGAGANPTITPEIVQKHGLLYRALDKSEGEVNKSGMQKMSIVDVCATNIEIPGSPFDMIFSQAVAEHFSNATNAYQNMIAALAPGGLCVHQFSTLFSLPFLLNRFLPDAVSDFLLNRFAHRDREKHGKFKAYYSHCRGPVADQINFFTSLGYDVLEYRAYFGHNYYQSKLPLLHFLEEKKTQLLVKWPLAYFTSYACVVLQRPFCQ